VGRLLQLLTSLSGVRRVCELGTAYGVGAAWIESGLGPSAVLVTVEADPRRAAAASSIFGDHERVNVIHGDWSAAKDRRVFDLLFSDGGPKRNRGDPAKLLPMLKRGGLVVLDDFTPNFGLDPTRDMWLGDPAYRAMELTVSPRASVILATKR
jgi:predicted O-methyltransferase YrrM